jgi:hypothetical protein
VGAFRRLDSSFRSLDCLDEKNQTTATEVRQQAYPHDTNFCRLAEFKKLTAGGAGFLIGEKLFEGGDVLKDHFYDVLVAEF